MRSDTTAAAAAQDSPGRLRFVVAWPNFQSSLGPLPGLGMPIKLVPSNPHSLGCPCLLAGSQPTLPTRLRSPHADASGEAAWIPRPQSLARFPLALSTGVPTDCTQTRRCGPLSSAAHPFVFSLTALYPSLPGSPNPSAAGLWATLGPDAAPRPSRLLRPLWIPRACVWATQQGILPPA